MPEIESTPSIPSNTSPEYVFAACTSNNPTLLCFLFQNGADVNCIDPITGESPLIYSCRINNSDCVRALIQCGASHDFKDVQGWTALHWAAYSGNSEIVELLFMSGANVNAVSNHGQVPCELAFFQGHNNVGVFLRSASEQAMKLSGSMTDVSGSYYNSSYPGSYPGGASYDEAGIVPTSRGSSMNSMFDSQTIMSCPEQMYGYSAIPGWENNPNRRKCIRCSATQTPQWRRGPDGQVNLCNACGLRHLKNLKSQNSKSAKSSPAASSPLKTEATSGDSVPTS